jgi:hypothetical protein
MIRGSKEVTFAETQEVAQSLFQSRYAMVNGKRPTWIFAHREAAQDPPPQIDFAVAVLRGFSGLRLIRGLQGRCRMDAHLPTVTAIAFVLHNAVDLCVDRIIPS